MSSLSNHPSPGESARSASPQAPVAAVVRSTLRTWIQALGYVMTLARVQPSGSGVGGRHILFVCRALPPHFHGGTFRQVALLRGLARHNWAVSALTNMPPSAPSAAGLEAGREVPGAVRFVRWTQSSEVIPSWRFSPQVDGEFYSIAPIIRALADARVKPDVVVASGPPFAEFIASAVIARRLKVPYVLDYRDEWTSSDLSFVSRTTTDQHWERLVLRGARMVVFTTDAARIHYLTRFPFLRSSSTRVIRNGWDEPPSDPEASQTTRNRDRLMIGYFGRLADWTQFEGFLSMIEQASLMPGHGPPFQVRIQGRVDAVYQDAILHSGAVSYFRIDDMVPRSECRQCMQECDALLLLNSPLLARYLPGKVFEYLAARRPIVVYGRGGELEKLLAGVPGTVFVERNQPAAFLTALSRLSTGAPARAIVEAGDAYLDQFSRHHSVKQWGELLEHMVGPG